LICPKAFDRRIGCDSASQRIAAALWNAIEKVV
jgi:hypothetical protein